jgi:hypothetical protein
MLKFDMERFSHKKLREMKAKEHHQVKISIRFANLENLDHNVEINRAWENVRDTIKISGKESLGYYKLK